MGYCGSKLAPKMSDLHNSGSALRIFKNILLNERQQEVHEDYIAFS